jgi:hypothetical protein
MEQAVGYALLGMLAGTILVSCICKVYVEVQQAKWYARGKSDGYFRGYHEGYTSQTVHYREEDL